MFGVKGCKNRRHEKQRASNESRLFALTTSSPLLPPPRSSPSSPALRMHAFRPACEDHGLLAICLHANGARVVAGDKAARPLEVARANVDSYLRHARERAAAAAGHDVAGWKIGNPGVSDARTNDPGNAGNVPLGLQGLECRQGDGLAVLEEGEVDTVCIAGVGVNTMIGILAAAAGRDRQLDPGGPRSSPRSPGRVSDLSYLRIERLVLQPMNARLKYLRDLRVWLRENGWRITQETITMVTGKGGRRMYLTLRAELEHANGGPSSSRISGDRVHGEADQDVADWLGVFLPSRTTDADRLNGPGSRDRRREALSYLAYLRHQLEWLRAIERARPVEDDGGDAGSLGPVAAEIERVTTSIEKAVLSVGAST